MISWNYEYRRQAGRFRQCLLKISEESLSRLILVFGARLNNVSSKKYRIWRQFYVMQASWQVFEKPIQICRCIAKLVTVVTREVQVGYMKPSKICVKLDAASQKS